MGCISSKKDINNTHPNIFQVTNVDDGGRAISPGQLEVTEIHLVFYQRGKNPTHWPLRCLRKYGFDTEIFSFECGRRCPTGHGIYAFRCIKAEQLFNVVQQNIQLRNLTDDNQQLSDLPFSLTTTGPPACRRISQADSYLNSSGNFAIRSHSVLNRPSSVTSNEALSPPVTSPLSLLENNIEQNNNKRESLILEHSYTNIGTTEDHLNIPSYINVTMSKTAEHCETQNSNNRVYMNISCKGSNVDSHSEENYDLNLEHSSHCYVNIQTTELDEHSVSKIIDFESGPHIPTFFNALTEVNYAELDLTSMGSTTPLTPENPIKIKGYVTIDFNKTNALSQSVNPRIDLEEGSRKTRHNSTISDVPIRIRHSSLSD